MPEKYLQPHYIEQIKKEFLDKYHTQIPRLKERIEDVFLEAMVIFATNYKLGKLTKLKAPIRDYVFAITLKILAINEVK